VEGQRGLAGMPIDVDFPVVIFSLFVIGWFFATEKGSVKLFLTLDALQQLSLTNISAPFL
jgi:hypothetical protein